MDTPAVGNVLDDPDTETRAVDVTAALLERPKSELDLARDTAISTLKARAIALDTERPGTRHIFHAEFVNGHATGAHYLRALASLCSNGAVPALTMFTNDPVGHPVDGVRFLVGMAAVPAAVAPPQAPE
jgi:hypothetical protein